MEESVASCAAEARTGSFSRYNAEKNTDTECSYRVFFLVTRTSKYGLMHCN